MRMAQDNMTSNGVWHGINETDKGLWHGINETARDIWHRITGQQMAYGKG